MTFRKADVLLLASLPILNVPTAYRRQTDLCEVHIIDKVTPCVTSQEV